MTPLLLGRDLLVGFGTRAWLRQACGEQFQGHDSTSLDVFFEFLTYQLWTVRYLLPVAMTGDGGLGFDSGEGA